jgi:hypothetical protein
MKKPIMEADVIGGQGQLTKEEEIAISKYLADQKAKRKKNVMVSPKIKKKEKID